MIAGTSPRGAAALLRLAIQMLCVELGLPGKDLNSDIGELVKRGLPTIVQKALDSVRVLGNEAVHPGTIDLTDDASTVETLLKMVNFIAEQMITQPKQVAELFESLPENKRDQIERRDAQLG